MGCLANFVSPDKLLEYDELEECDIIEFNRLTYSHFGFYIGDGICVNVTGPDNNGGFSSSSSSSFSKIFPKGMKQAERLVDIAGSDFRYNKVRINNCVLTATAFGVSKRTKSDAINKALEGLKRDEDGKVILEEPIAYNYNLIGNNCECFATRCRYQGEGFSVQAINPTMGSTLGTVERVTSAVRHDLAEKVMDNDEDIGTRSLAAVGYVGYTAAGWTAYGAKTATDAITSGATSILNIFK